MTSSGKHERSFGWLYLAFLVLVVFIGACGYFGWRVFSKVSDIEEAAALLDGQVAKAKALGVPLTASDLKRKPALASSDNGVYEFQRALADLDAASINIIDLAVAAENGNVVAAEKILAPTKSALAHAHKAATYRGMDFHRDWDLGPLVMFPELAKAKNLSKVLCGHAEVKAKKGNHDAAIKDLRTISHFAQNFGDDSIIAGLVRVACHAIMFKAVERCLSFAIDPEGFKKYIAFLEEEPRPADVMQMMKAECYIGVTVARNERVFGVKEGGVGQGRVFPDDLIRTGLPTDLIGKAHLARRLQIWNQIFEQSKDSKDTTKVFEVAERVYNVQVDKSLPSYQLEHQILGDTEGPIYVTAGQAITLREKQMWEINGALAKALLFKKENGRFPKSLLEIGVKSVDPFSGHPYGYIVKPDEVRIYSVGRDRKDNGGRRNFEVAGDTNHDDVASYPPVEASQPIKVATPVKNVKPVVNRRKPAKR